MDSDCGPCPKQHTLSRHNAHVRTSSTTRRNCDKLGLIKSGTGDVGLSTSNSVLPSLGFPRILAQYKYFILLLNSSFALTRFS